MLVISFDCVVLTFEVFPTCYEWRSKHTAILLHVKWKYLHIFCTDVADTSYFLETSASFDYAAVAVVVMPLLSLERTVKVTSCYVDIYFFVKFVDCVLSWELTLRLIAFIVPVKFLSFTLLSLLYVIRISAFITAQTAAICLDEAITAHCSLLTVMYIWGRVEDGTLLIYLLLLLILLLIIWC